MNKVQHIFLYVLITNSRLQIIVTSIYIMNLTVTKEVCDVRMCFMGVSFYRGLWKMFQGERGVVTIYGLTLMPLQHLMLAQSHIKKIQSTAKQKPTKYFIAQGFNTLNRGTYYRVQFFPKPHNFIVFVGFTILLFTWFRAMLAVGCVTKLAQRGTVPNCANGISSQVRPLYWHFYINRTSDIKSLALIFYIEKTL